MASIVGRTADRLLNLVAPRSVAAAWYCDRCAGPWTRVCEWYCSGGGSNCGYSCGKCNGAC